MTYVRTLGELERDAAAQDITPTGLAQDREYPPSFVALAAAIEVAVRYEHTARMYDIETLRAKAREIREGVEALARVYDHAAELKNVTLIDS